MSNFTPTEKTKVRRKPERGSYDRELIYSILDEAFVCHVAFISDGLPIVVPTNYVRVGDKLFLHGSTASRLMKTLASGGPFCLSVTLLDGIVCAPSATGHSVNYRSVVVMGKAEPVEGERAKLAAMRDFVEYVIRGRWATVRLPTEQELKGTMVVSVPLVEATRLAIGWPLIFIGAFNTSDTNTDTSGRPEASRWSSTNHRDQLAPPS